MYKIRGVKLFLIIFDYFKKFKKKKKNNINNIQDVLTVYAIFDPPSFWFVIFKF